MPITIKKRADTSKKQQETRIEGAAQKAAAFLSAHRKTLKPAAALLAAVALIAAGYLFVQSGRDKEASVLLTAAYGYYSPSGPGVPDYVRALDLYRDIQKKILGHRKRRDSPVLHRELPRGPREDG